MNDKLFVQFHLNLWDQLFTYIYEILHAISQILEYESIINHNFQIIHQLHKKNQSIDDRKLSPIQNILSNLLDDQFKSLIIKNYVRSLEKLIID